jgi:hypothetical protein
VKLHSAACFCRAIDEKKASFARISPGGSDSGRREGSIKGSIWGVVSLAIQPDIPTLSVSFISL